MSDLFSVCQQAVKPIETEAHREDIVAVCEDIKVSNIRITVLNIP